LLQSVLGRSPTFEQPRSTPITGPGGTQGSSGSTGPRRTRTRERAHTHQTAPSTSFAGPADHGSFLLDPETQEPHPSWSNPQRRARCKRITGIGLDDAAGQTATSTGGGHHKGIPDRASCRASRPQSGRPRPAHRDRGRARETSYQVRDRSAAKPTVAVDLTVHCSKTPCHDRKCVPRPAQNTRKAHKHRGPPANCRQLPAEPIPRGWAIHAQLAKRGLGLRPHVGPSDSYCLDLTLPCRDLGMPSEGASVRNRRRTPARRRVDVDARSRSAFCTLRSPSNRRRRVARSLVKRVRPYLTWESYAKPFVAPLEHSLRVGSTHCGRSEHFMSTVRA